MADEALLDPDHLDAQTFGDAELAQELLSLFREQCRRLLPSIGDTGLDGRERADLAHALKGSALGIGARRVAARADAVERVLRTTDTDADCHVRALADAAAATLRAIDGSG